MVISKLQIKQVNFTFYCFNLTDIDKVITLITNLKKQKNKQKNKTKQKKHQNKDKHESSA